MLGEDGWREELIEWGGGRDDFGSPHNRIGYGRKAPVVEGNTKLLSIHFQQLVTNPVALFLHCLRLMVVSSVETAFKAGMHHPRHCDLPHLALAGKPPSCFRPHTLVVQG